MRLIRHVGEARPPVRPRVIAEGEFDGLHLGHQRVLAAVVARARALHGEASVLLHRHSGDAARLTDLREQLEGLAAAGVDTAVLTRSNAAADALQRLVPSVYVTGRAAPASVPPASVETVAAVMAGSEPISAAAIRSALAAGDLAAAHALLGRDPDVSGRIVHGFHRGAPLGIPTANIRVRGVQLPPDGVYAVRAQIGGRPLRGVANLGFNPTFGNRTRSIETHLLDFSGDIYGARLRIAFVARLRGEQKFAGIDALLAQIRADIAAARRLFERDE